MEVIMELFFLLVSLISIVTSIRVDFNTNKGPIIPPTSTERPIPQPPFREPAPVWEDQSNDIPNPNPYQYILPPPSRPKVSPIDYSKNEIKTDQTTNTHYNPSNKNNQITTENSKKNQYNTVVNALAPYYIPNKGFKYEAVFPRKVHNVKASDFDYKYNKLNGKYNAKLKKYKAYEKQKYFPSRWYLVENNYYKPHKNNGQLKQQQQQQQQQQVPQQQIQNYNIVNTNTARHNSFTHEQESKYLINLVNASYQPLINNNRRFDSLNTILNYR